MKTTDYEFLTLEVRKAQKYLGTSSNNAGISNTVSHENLAMAKVLLDSISEETEPRTKCLIEYTHFDLHRLSGNIEEAKDHYKIALNLARKYELQQFELHSLHIRTHLLNMSIEKQNERCPFC